MLRVIFQPKARNDLLNIFDMIAEDSPKTALKLTQNIRSKTIQQLTHFPYMGVAREDLGNSIRLLHFPAQRISVAYCVIDDTVMIKRVFYAGANYHDRLKDE